MSLLEITGQIAPVKRYLHAELVLDLAKFLQTPYHEVALGSRIMGAERQADVIDIRKYSYNDFELSIYECKCTRSDFLNEIRSRKYKDSLPFCTHFYFATESDVAFLEDIPLECGWLVRLNGNWVLRKKAKKRKLDIPHDFLLALLFKKKGLYAVRDKQSTIEKRETDQDYF
jgi:hypothetical protein